jgi:very-short-patch-repair endonuclease
VHRGVYATFTGDLGREALLWAAVLRAGVGAALSHQTAAELIGLTDTPSKVIHVTVPLDRHPEPVPGVVVHRSWRIGLATHPAQIPPRTRVEETVLDLVQTSISLDEACAWLSRAAGRRLTTAARLQRALDDRARIRWRADLELILADVSDGAHSLLEHRYIRDVERAHGLPAARRQVKIVLGSRTRFLDNLYAEAGLAVELDGQIAHAIEERWADMQRDNAHAAVGIITLRYNWADVTLRACRTAQQVVDVLRERRTVLTPRPCSPGCPVTATPMILTDLPQTAAANRS